jgi:hypothetical protein
VNETARKVNDKDLNEKVSSRPTQSDGDRRERTRRERTEKGEAGQKKERQRDCDVEKRDWRKATNAINARRGMPNAKRR